MDKAPAPYYYASGQRVTLELDGDHTALDLGATAGAQRKSLERMGRVLSASVVLLDKHEGGPSKAAIVDGALQLPVFKSGNTLLVALPEVRIEDEDERAIARVVAWLRAEPDQGKVLETSSGRVTLQAGPGLDFGAVSLAREVVERCGVASASPRLMRVTPAPKR